MANKPKTMILTLNESIEGMITRIQERSGAMNRQDAIRRAITAYHEELMPAYTQKLPSQRLNRTPEQRAQDDIDAKAHLAEKKKQASYELCHSLGGEVKGGACHYRTFTKQYGTKVHAGVSSVSLETISQETLDKQFINTSREEATEQGLM